MKAISLTQPWASLIAAGLKRIETRPKATSHRGPIAIHAAKYFRAADHGTLRSGRPGLLELCARPQYAEPLEAAGLSPASLPMGEIVAIAELFDCVRHDAELDEIPRRVRLNFAGRFEQQLGGYGIGRVYYVLSNVQPIKPLPWRGALYLFDVPDELLVP